MLYLTSTLLLTVSSQSGMVNGLTVSIFETPYSVCAVCTDGVLGMCDSFEEAKLSLSGLLS